MDDNVSEVVAGKDDDDITPDDFIGSAGNMKGIHALDKVDDVSLVSIPGNGEPRISGASSIQKIVQDGMDYCKNNRPLGDLFFIADMPSITKDRDGAIEFVNSLARSYYASDLFSLDVIIRSSWDR